MYDKKEFWSIPNLLTYFRIILIPFFIWSYWTVVEPMDYIKPAIILVASGLSDCADGFIARRFNMITEWGKLVDPIADKLTQAAIAVCLVLHYPWFWLLFGVLVVKELHLSITSLYILKKYNRKMNGAKWYGKVSTTVFYLVVIVLIAYPLMPDPIAYTMMGISIFFLLLAFVLYGRDLNQMRKES